ncbi:MAG: hypothetical protein EOP08_10155, partial [Proteobacteria bacterium]
MNFLLFEQFKLGELLGTGPFEAWGEEEVRSSVSEAYRFAREVIGPLNATGDAQGCRIENGRVITPEGFKNAWTKLYEGGWKSIAVDPEWGGAGAPHTLQIVIEELMSGANTAFMMYSGLTFGAAEVIEHFGTDEQKKLYCEKMFGGTWGGTMCLTEPQAGSDVGASRTTASKNPDGSYTIRGTKIYISGGDHDLAENIVHLVLARVDGAPAGTKGLTLFIVPRIKPNADGSLGEFNDVLLGNIEHKMGINGSATCVLNFGEAGTCVGWPVGGDAKVISIHRRRTHKQHVFYARFVDVRDQLPDFVAEIFGIFRSHFWRNIDHERCRTLEKTRDIARNFFFTKLDQIRLNAAGFKCF